MTIDYEMEDVNSLHFYDLEIYDTISDEHLPVFPECIVESHQVLQLQARYSFAEGFKKKKHHCCFKASQTFLFFSSFYKIATFERDIHHFIWTYWITVNTVDTPPAPNLPDEGAKQQ